MTCMRSGALFVVPTTSHVDVRPPRVLAVLVQLLVAGLPSGGQR